jgi:hypothetical protein
MYKGQELVEAAKKLVNMYKEREEIYRQKISKSMEDRTVAVNSSKNKKMEAIINDASLRREQCEVYAHEFARTPDREFSLTLSDVVFFGLAGHKISEPDSEDI